MAVRLAARDDSSRATGAQTKVGVVEDPPATATRGGGRARGRTVGLRELTWLGAVVCTAGFAVIAIGWGKVAAETRVHLQLPYIASGAFVGIAIVMVGLTLLNHAATQRDAIARDDEIALLIRTIESLRSAIEERTQP